MFSDCTPLSYCLIFNAPPALHEASVMLTSDARDKVKWRRSSRRLMGGSHVLRRRHRGSKLSGRTLTVPALPRTGLYMPTVIDGPLVDEYVP